jgi:glycosyltransferase involved in cell wall biosynthesis
MTHPNASPAPSTLLVFADDWGRHPSSCQHTVSKLLLRHDVIWVNTIGMRAPGLDPATIRRGVQKLSHWFGAGPRDDGVRQQHPRLRVLNPKMWPWFRSTFDRWINRELLLRQIAPIVKNLPAPPIAVTTIPIVSDLIGRLPVERWVYYCVDDFSLWPGLDQSALRRIEEPLIARCDVLIAASVVLRDKLASLGREAHLMTHGVDLDFWSNPRNSGNISLPELESLSRPMVAYWGLVDPRLDVEFLRRLRAEMTEGSVVLVGPEADADPELRNVPGLDRLPAQPIENLPHVARAASVLIMPYADLPVTRVMQPLKMLEYLATGKPVVARDLPATRAWADALDLVDSPETFAAAVRHRLETGLPESQRVARERLSRETWTEKSRIFEKWILGINAEEDLIVPDQEPLPIGANGP